MIMIEESARSVFPDLAVQALRIDGFVEAAEKVDMTDLDRRVQDAVRRADPAPANWRPVYRRMGLQPSKFLSSVEALTKRAAKTGTAWKTGQTSIDVYNAMSIIHGAPLGCYDAQSVGTADIVIRPMNRECDSFVPVSGIIDISKGNDDLLVYAVESAVLCWALNHRDSGRFCLRPETRLTIVASESTSPEQKDASRAALSELSDLLQMHGAQIEWLETNFPFESVGMEEAGGRP